jgi:hypothetical protein
MPIHFINTEDRSRTCDILCLRQTPLPLGYLGFVVVPLGRVELPRSYEPQVLSLRSLPFHHNGMSSDERTRTSSIRVSRTLWSANCLRRQKVSLGRVELPRLSATVAQTVKSTNSITATYCSASSLLLPSVFCGKRRRNSSHLFRLYLRSTPPFGNGS